MNAALTNTVYVFEKSYNEYSWRNSRQTVDVDISSFYNFNEIIK